MESGGGFDLPNEMLAAIESYMLPADRQAMAQVNHLYHEELSGTVVVQSDEEIVAALTNPNVRIIAIRPLHTHMVCLNGTSHAEIFADGTGLTGRLIVRAEVEVYARNDAVVAATAGVVHAGDNADLQLSDSARGTAHGTARVDAMGSSSVSAFGQSYVAASDTCYVEAVESSLVHARDYAQVTAFHNSHVLVTGNSAVEAHDAVRVKADDHARVRVHGTGVRVYIRDDSAVTIEGVSEEDAATVILRGQWPNDWNY
ncbi:hypothetical protein [Streptomyces chartreusis]|uniref:hypothetical protein n=1 Tax=Streptomyces chartreusis TaxID=1969 RepID=UPI0033DBBD19